MGKALYISEKPSVAQEFAKALHINGKPRDGYLESDEAIVTWCVGHLVTMSYPERYDSVYKKWSLETLPFLPEKFLYEVIPSVSKQFNVVKGLLNREDVSTIYVCTDSGREGEYIYRLVDEMAGVKDTKETRRVWIDSQTEEEILRGIKEAKPLSAYDNLSSAAYLRAKEDYLMGINFSRVLSLKYGQNVNGYLNNKKWSSISVGRVMTCVLGMVVRREQEIRDFVKTPFYRVVGTFGNGQTSLLAEWKAVEGSKYFETPFLYKENGFRERETAEELIRFLIEPEKPKEALVERSERKKENKQPPLLFNLAELQNVCSRLFKISPDETLKITQELYEKKLVTYPRTDARVLSTAVSKEIYKNISGLRNYSYAREYAEEILSSGSYKNIAKTKYVNDKQITDHYAIIPTGQGFGALKGLTPTAAKVYETIVRRFLSIFYPPAVYQKTAITLNRKEERFFANFRLLSEEGYLKVTEYSFLKKKKTGEDGGQGKEIQEEAVEHPENAENGDTAENGMSPLLLEMINSLKKGSHLTMEALEIKEGETSPPKRYSSGSMILAMENAGQLIEDEELRAQIKGSGIGTSATRAEILNKLVKIAYLNLNKKTQIITPTLQGELIYHVVNSSIRSLLNPELTASWEKGLTYVAEGTITEEEYMQKLEGFVRRLTDGVKGLNNQAALRSMFDKSASYYKNKL
ncbi:MAG: DNA topoisomerase [Acetivibrio ethanolgignens]